jgi:hypothetical protein
VTISGVISLASFNHSEKKTAGHIQPVASSAYIPLYKMIPDTVENIISGIPMDKRIIFQFVIDGSATSATEVIWYKASGMENHGQNKPLHKLEAISGTTGLVFGTSEKYILANNYLYVKSFKDYVKSLPSMDFEYLEFKPMRNSANYVYFKIRAVYKGKKLKDLGYPIPLNTEEDNQYFDAGIESQPSPPANHGGN